MRPPSSLEQALIRTTARFWSRGGGRPSLLVLIFHRVFPEPDPLLFDEPDAARFASIMDLLGSCFSVLPLREALHRLQSGTLPNRAACVTFDDGYANNLEVAQPILAAKGLPATVFVAPGFLDGGRMFNDTLIETLRRAPSVLDLRSVGLERYELDGPSSRRNVLVALLSRLKYFDFAERLERIQRIADISGVSLPSDLMMTRAQVAVLHRRGIEIGAHTMDHPILTSVDDATARAQIRASKSELEAIVGEPVRSFAYPNGCPQRDYDARHVAMVREAGFDLALSTAWGAATQDSDPFQIPRVAAWDHTPLRHGLRLARAYRDRTYKVA